MLKELHVTNKRIEIFLILSRYILRKLLLIFTEIGFRHQWQKLKFFGVTLNSDTKIQK